MRTSFLTLTTVVIVTIFIVFDNLELTDIRRTIKFIRCIDAISTHSSPVLFEYLLQEFGGKIGAAKIHFLVA